MGGLSGAVLQMGDGDGDGDSDGGVLPTPADTCAAFYWPRDRAVPVQTSALP
jgi:hypothetical protein